MSYTREIDNTVLIQYMILFTLKKADRHVTYKQLATLILDNFNIEFTNFQLALSNLEETEHIRGFSVDELTTVYELLPKGIEANNFFQKDIPIYIREPIENAIPPFFKEEEEKRSIRSELIPINRKEFSVKCGIYDKNTPLFEFILYSGTREDANKMLKKFRDNPEKFYSLMLNLMGEDE